MWVAYPDATILLVHDSLGCVDLWRDFPQHLAVATRRPWWTMTGSASGDLALTRRAVRTIIRDELWLSMVIR